MEKLERLIAETDPDVPFRASTTHTHHTWAKTFQSRPELYLRPQSLEEIQKIVTLARKLRRRLVVVGCGHSPSDLTCTSSWMVNLDQYDRVLKVDKVKKTLLVEGGIRLRQLNERANEHGLTVRNLGSIDEQSIAGAIATATHGSSLKHGLLSESVRSLRVVLSNGHAVRCSAEQNVELFRACLVSLGALGIITEVEFEMTKACNIEWTQSLEPLDQIIATWDTTLWTRKEFTRVWWMPYMKRAIVWSAEKTSKPERAAEGSWYGGSVGFHTYHNLLWLSNRIPSILPWVEWFVFGMQYGFRTGKTTSAIEPLRTGLLMNCLYSQFVNEWAIPLSKGPEAITRLSGWLNGRPEIEHQIPYSCAGLYVHCPIEVRVSDSRNSDIPRPYLDNTCKDEPTLYLNATLYRAYLEDPPCRDRYYEAFEYLMRELGGKPHWAKNFSFTKSSYISEAFGDDVKDYLRVRDEADPEGMFLGEWHRRILPLANKTTESEGGRFPLEEREVSRHLAPNGGQKWTGEVASRPDGRVSAFQQPGQTEKATGNGDSTSASSAGGESMESFDMMHAAEGERSRLFGDGGAAEEEEEEEGVGQMEIGERRTHGNPMGGIGGTKVFDKM